MIRYKQKVNRDCYKSKETRNTEDSDTEIINRIESLKFEIHNEKCRIKEQAIKSE